MILLPIVAIARLYAANFIGYIEEDNRAFGVLIDTSAMTSAIGFGFDFDIQFKIKKSSDSIKLSFAETKVKPSIWFDKRYTLVDDTSIAGRKTGIWDCERGFKGKSVVFSVGDSQAIQKIQKSGVLTQFNRSAPESEYYYEINIPKLESKIHTNDGKFFARFKLESIKPGIFKEVKILEEKSPLQWYWYKKMIFVNMDEKTGNVTGFWFGDDRIGYGEIYLTNRLDIEISSAANRQNADTIVSFDRIIASGDFVVFDKMNFRKSSYDIDSISQARILKLLPVIKEKSCRVIIVGHADKTGNFRNNTRLSESRAKSVKSVLVSKGVAAEKIEAYGMGSSLPIDNSETEEANLKNRRVEIKIIRD